VFLNVPTMQQPEAYTGHANEHGKLVSDSTRIFQHDFMHAFADWVETVGSQGHHI
jgi:chromate reductase, NAD(P)H dehydrogenase (quinone)